MNPAPVHPGRAARHAARTLLAAATLAAGALAAACAPRRDPAAAPAPPAAAARDSAAPTPPARAGRAGRDSAEARTAPVRQRAGRAAARPRRAARRRPAPPAVSDAGPVTAPVRVCAGGDVTLGTNLDTAWAAAAAWRLGRRVAALPPPERLLAPVGPLLRGADLVLLNVEGAVGDDRPAPSKCAPNEKGCFALRMPAAAAPALRGAASRAEVVGNLANNHARDAGPGAPRRTAELLRAAGVHVTGLDTLATPVPTARGDTVALLGFSTSARPDARDTAAVRRHVARAAARFRRVVVTAHMGAEGAGAQRTRDTVERYFGEHRGNPVAFADAAVAGGAALVVLHGPHVLRAMEWRGGQLVAYSLGNLVTYGPFAFREPMVRGAVLCASLDAAGHARRATLAATRQRRPGLVAADRAGRAYRLVDSLGRLDFPRTAARVTRAGAVLRPRPPRRAPRPAESR